MYDVLSELFNDLLELYFDEYFIEDPANLTLAIVTILYTENSVNEKELHNLPPLEGYEEVKEEKRLKILTPNKLLTRLTVLLDQIKLKTIQKI